MAFSGDTTKVLFIADLRVPPCHRERHTLPGYGLFRYCEPLPGNGTRPSEDATRKRLSDRRRDDLCAAGLRKRAGG